MKISPVSGAYHYNAANYSRQSVNSDSQVSVPDLAPVPMNYGADLVSFKKKSGQSACRALDAKLTAAFDLMDINQYLVVTNNVKNLKKIMEQACERIAAPIEKIYFIEEPKINETLFFFLTPLQETMFLNVNEKPLRYNGVDSIPSKEIIPLFNEDRILLSNGWHDINFGEPIVFDSNDIFTEVYDFTQRADNTVEGFNKSVITELGHVKQKSKPKKSSHMTFAQVGGQDHVIDALKKNLLFPMKYPEAFEGLMVSRGAVLYGPPGTGKTLLAQTLASEAGASTFYISGTDLESKYVGESEKNCRELFQKAVDGQPSIICIDEFDALGKARGGVDVYGDKLLNQLLALMSDIEKRGDNVVVIGSTNRIQSLDPAILRSGRFDLQLEVKAPDLAGTRQILDIKVESEPLDEEVNLDDIAKKMHAKNMTGADITAVVRNAHINALERCGIFKSMEEGRFSPQMMDYFSLSAEDFDKAITDFNGDLTKRKPVGY